MINLSKYNLFNFEKKIILITGSSGQIGTSFSKLFLSQNAIVIGMDKIENKLKNKNFYHFKLDVSNILSCILVSPNKEIELETGDKFPKFEIEVKLLLLARFKLTEVETGERNVWVDGGWQSAKIYNRLDLPEESSISGPALLEQSDTTIFLEPDLEGSVDKLGNLIISRRE